MRVNLFPFREKKHESANNLPQVEVKISYNNSTLELNYLVSDPANSIRWPLLDDNQTRAHELWRGTCFEFFYFPNSENKNLYTEWNFCSNKKWQCYDFNSYRVPSPPLESPIPQELRPIISYKDSNLNVRLDDLNLQENTLINISAIIELEDGRKIAYAIFHPQHLKQADFHHKDGFIAFKSLGKTT